MPQESPSTEKYLLEHAYRGEPAIFPVETSVDARFLREHILELVSTDDEGNARHRSCLLWVIHNAVFNELLDLADGRSSNGASIPALEFHGCEFRNGFSAAGAQIDRLAFNNCRFTSDNSRRNSIHLRNVRIGSEFRLENVKLAEGKLFWVDAFACSIGTNFVVHDTLLKAPANQSPGTAQEVPYALDLSTSEIHRDLILEPRVEIEGGLRMRDARVGGTVWARGLRATDGETD